MEEDQIIIPVRITIKMDLIIKIAKSARKIKSGGNNMGLDNHNLDLNRMMVVNTKHHLTSVME